MKAMIFAAGLGTRLQPLTNDRPKALVEVNGLCLLEIALQKLIASGCDHAIINVHHFADMVIDFLKKKNNFGIKISISDERSMLLETGGGLKKAKRYFQDAPFIIYNTDIITNLNIRDLYSAHLKSNAIATLAVRNRNTSRYLLFDKENYQLKGWTNKKTAECKWSTPSSGDELPFAFSGIQVVSPEIFKYIPRKKVFSTIELYLEAAKDSFIKAYPHDEDIWIDAGKPNDLEEAKKILKDVL